MWTSIVLSSFFPCRNFCAEKFVIFLYEIKLVTYLQHVQAKCPIFRSTEPCLFLYYFYPIVFWVSRASHWEIYSYFGRWACLLQRRPFLDWLRMTRLALPLERGVVSLDLNVTHWKLEHSYCCQHIMRHRIPIDSSSLSNQAQMAHVSIVKQKKSSALGWSFGLGFGA